MVYRSKKVLSLIIAPYSNSSTVNLDQQTILYTQQLFFLILLMYLCPIDTTLFIVITGRCLGDDIGDALQVNDRCYWMIREHLVFIDAHKRCQEDGGILAEIPDTETQNAVEGSDETLKIF